MTTVPFEDLVVWSSSKDNRLVSCVTKSGKTGTTVKVLELTPYGRGYHQSGGKIRDSRNSGEKMSGRGGDRCGVNAAAFNHTPASSPCCSLPHSDRPNSTGSPSIPKAGKPVTQHIGEGGASDRSHAPPVSEQLPESIFGLQLTPDYLAFNHKGRGKAHLELLLHTRHHRLCSASGDTNLSDMFYLFQS